MIFSDRPPTKTAERCGAMRKTALELNDRLIGMAGIVHPITAARAMGIEVVDKTVVFDSDSDISLLSEYSIYYHLSKGKRHFQRILAEDQTLSEAEQEILNCHEKSFSSVWEVTALHPEVWEIDLLDVIGKRGSMTIIDQSMSQTVPIGVWLHARLVPYDGFTATSGVALPVFVPDKEEDLEFNEEEIKKTILRNCRGALQYPGKRTRRHALFYVCRKLHQKFGTTMLYG
jgi:hypothetical protein